MGHAFTPAAFIGVALLAVWVHVRFPRIRPRSFGAVGFHLLASIIVFGFVPGVLVLARQALPLRLAVAIGVGGVVVPTFCYVLLSWLWLLVHLLDRGSSTPRGGHPVDAR